MFCLKVLSKHPSSFLPKPGCGWNTILGYRKATVLQWEIYYLNVAVIMEPWLITENLSQQSYKWLSSNSRYVLLRGTYFYFYFSVFQTAQNKIIATAKASSAPMLSGSITWAKKVLWKGRQRQIEEREEESKGLWLAAKFLSFIQWELAW